MLFPAELIKAILTYFNLTVEHTAIVENGLGLVLFAVYWLVFFFVAIKIFLYVWSKVDSKGYQAAKDSENF